MVVETFFSYQRVLAMPHQGKLILRTIALIIPATPWAISVGECRLRRRGQARGTCNDEITEGTRAATGSALFGKRHLATRVGNYEGTATEYRPGGWGYFNNTKKDNIARFNDTKS